MPTQTLADRIKLRMERKARSRRSFATRGSDAKLLKSNVIPSFGASQIAWAPVSLRRICPVGRWRKHVNDPPTCGPELRDKVALIQRVYWENPTAADAVKERLRKDPTSNALDVEHMRARSLVHIQEINQHMQDFRVLCVSTHNGSERMWTRYAQDHQGIGLRIQPNVAKDSKFQLFRPVQYRASRPPLYDDTLNFLEGSLFGDQLAKTHAIINKIVYSKTLEWEHESEYRLAIPLRQGEKDWNIMPYHPEEITELYLGLAMTKDNKDDVVAKAIALNPNIAIFEARRDSDDKLVFDEL
jgi:hypothetical protein